MRGIDALYGTSSSIILADGRVLTYAQCGAPLGFPVFYFHGTPSSRLEAIFAESAAHAHDFRLIAVDRPGFGGSSFQHNRCFSNWPSDIEALATVLGFHRFGIAGHSGAGPHLFACGAAFSNDRLAFIGALAPWGPIGNGKDLNRLDRFYATIAGDYPHFMRAAFAPLGALARWTPHFFLFLLKQGVLAPDREKLLDPDVGSALKIILEEAFRQGSHGAAHEAMIAYRTWDFALADVQVPTIIWLGDKDVFVPVSMGERIAASIPQANLHIEPGKGHLCVEHWQDIFRTCRRQLTA